MALLGRACKYYTLEKMDLATTHIDHIVVTAPSLAAGVAYVQDVLGVPLQAGGEHARMGTHNCLLKLGKSMYLEVLSINPAAPEPGRPRWFRLDEEALNTTPHLVTWVARTNDIRLASAAAPDLFGNIEAMSRGQWKWFITIPGNGSLPFDGIAPMLIEWNSETHPAVTLADAGCSLVRLEGFHPQAGRITELLQSINFQDEFALFFIPPSEAPYLTALIQTPSGVRQLGAP